MGNTTIRRNTSIDLDAFDMGGDLGEPFDDGAVAGLMGEPIENDGPPPVVVATVGSAEADEAEDRMGRRERKTQSGKVVGGPASELAPPKAPATGPVVGAAVDGTAALTSAGMHAASPLSGARGIDMLAEPAAGDLAGPDGELGAPAFGHRVELQPGARVRLAWSGGEHPNLLVKHPGATRWTDHGDVTAYHPQDVRPLLPRPTAAALRDRKRGSVLTEAVYKGAPRSFSSVEKTAARASAISAPMGKVAPPAWAASWATKGRLFVPAGSLVEIAWDSPSTVPGRTAARVMVNSVPLGPLADFTEATQAALVGVATQHKGTPGTPFSVASGVVGVSGLQLVSPRAANAVSGPTEEDAVAGPYSNVGEAGMVGAATGCPINTAFTADGMWDLQCSSDPNCPVDGTRSASAANANGARWVTWMRASFAALGFTVKNNTAEWNIGNDATYNNDGSNLRAVCTALGMNRDIVAPGSWPGPDKVLLRAMQTALAQGAKLGPAPQVQWGYDAGSGKWSPGLASLGPCPAVPQPEVKCPPGSESDGAGGCRLIQATCTGNQVPDGAGGCIECVANAHPATDGSGACWCNDGFIVVNGDCVACPAGRQPDSSGEKCVCRDGFEQNPADPTGPCLPKGGPITVTCKAPLVSDGKGGCKCPDGTAPDGRGGCVTTKVTKPAQASIFSSPLFWLVGGTAAAGGYYWYKNKKKGRPPVGGRGL